MLYTRMPFCHSIGFFHYFFHSLFKRTIFPFFSISIWFSIFLVACNNYYGVQSVWFFLRHNFFMSVRFSLHFLNNVGRLHYCYFFHHQSKCWVNEITNFNTNKFIYIFFYMRHVYLFCFSVSHYKTGYLIRLGYLDCMCIAFAAISHSLLCGMFQCSFHRFY